jgi:polysaccharide deacetylase 2 family uncharacterized protein YibQ
VRAIHSHRSGSGRGWRTLAWFWLAVALGLGGGAAGLAWLGPPPETAAARPHPAPPEATPPTPAPEAAPPTALAAAPEAPAASIAPPTAPAVSPAAAQPPATEARDRAGAGAAIPPPPAPPIVTVAAATATAAVAAAVAASPPVPPAVLALPPAPEPPPLLAVAAPAVPKPHRPIAPPDPALLEPPRAGGGPPLPRIGPGGRTSIRAYARAFDRAESRPRVAVVLAGIGLSTIQTEEALRRLPGAIALALNPYADRLDQIAERARERGMETLIALPMEPTRYPLDDPGPQALLTGLPLVENLDRLDWALARSAGYVGVLGGLGGGMRGERFAQMAELLGTVQNVLYTRGLLYIDPRPGAPAPARAWGRSVDLVLDEPATRGEIERRLAELERLARERGSALGLAGDPAPVVIDRLAAWAAGLEARGLVLAPVTALIRRPESTAEAVPAAAASPPGR